MSRTEDQKSINEWQNATFPNATIHGTINHLKEEFQEFLDAEEDLDIQAIEVADLIILLYAWAGLRGIDLDQKVDDKMRINRKRRWRILPDGTGRHL